LASDSRMTVRLDPAARRKVERLAADQGLSLNEALNCLLRRAPDEGEPPSGRPPYRLKPREVGFGFEISGARRLAATLSDDRVSQTRKDRP
jgi:hypothetical protein